MFEGDNDARNNVILGKTYGDYLKCDILQADHHGDFGGVPEVNQLFAPSVIIYCQIPRKINPLLETEYNLALLHNPNYKEHIVTADRAYTMMLPYVPHTARVVHLED